ncbi:hypothetical protein DSO57_1000135 [Entomophthora muscae]|uniref:Uncharacterized protein n=1 Tax=Entomophthora muscae TaxID=34485 RepID=A0ACC2SMP9_9FUNG|nr:hypothetical protein DSO57_1000135 [Entomophthora muscae]
MLGLVAVVVVATFASACLVYLAATSLSSSKEPASEKIDAYAIGRKTVKDVKVNGIMTLQDGVLWTKDADHFTLYHMSFPEHRAMKQCLRISEEVTRCDVEEKRVFRWLPTEYVTPLVDCDETEKCFIPFPIFKTDCRVIPFHEADRFPIHEYILNSPRPTLHALQGRQLPFRGPAKRGIWYKVLYLYVQGYYNFTIKEQEPIIISYNHTVALDLGNGILDAIYGLTSDE